MLQTMNIQWNDYDFILQWHYHICAKAWPNPCESGYIEVYNTNPVKLQVDSTFDLSGPKVAFNANKAALVYNQGDILVYVDCTDTFCLIPV